MALNEIVLPPGSTSAELQDAIDTAASQDTIIISGDMPFADTVTIPAGKELTIQSDAGNNWALLSPGSNIRHIEVSGSLILQDITLDGGNIGGGIHINSGDLTINNGTVINNCHSYDFVRGGGGVLGDNGNLTMNGGIIKGNAGNPGGGVSLWLCNFTMTDGMICGNQDDGISGIVYYGGGVSLYWTPFTMTGGKICDNSTINGNAGGIGIYGSPVDITGNSFITNNRAPNGDGGGMFVSLADFNDLMTGPDTVFNCNQAAAAFAPPPDAGTLYPNVKFASTSIATHPLNNYDLNYTEGEPITVTYHVDYNANGGTGGYTGPDIEPDGTDTVLSPGETGIRREGYTFTDWNTEPDGSGTHYAAGDPITLNCRATVIYAQWVAAQRFTITYGANGGSGSFEDPGRQFGSNYTILSASQTGIGRPGYTFICWNTQPDGGGMSYTPGDSITISGDVRIFALWRQNSMPKPKKMCPKPVTKCRMAIEGQKIWMDDDNAQDTRSENVEILLLRDEKIYDRKLVDSTSGWAFGFCCLPVWKNSGHKYYYRIDEGNVPDGYTKTIEGYNIINTLTP